MKAYGTTDGLARAVEPSRSPLAERLAEKRRSIHADVAAVAETNSAVRTVLYALDRPEVWQAIAEHAAQTANEAEPGTRTHRALCRLVAVAADLADLLDCSGEQQTTYPRGA